MKRYSLYLASLLLIVCSLISCSSAQYNASIIKSGVTYNEAWLAQNYTRGSHQSGYDASLPESRTYIIKNQNELDEVFSVCPKIDFDKQILIVYCYTTTYVREQKLEKFFYENGVLSIDFGVVKGKIGVGDATAPGTRICIISLDKLDISSVVIKYTGQ